MLPAVLDSALTLSTNLAALADVAAALAENARAAATKRAYASDWAHFTEWCEVYGLAPLPAAPAIVGTYIAAHANSLAVATLTRRLATIAVAHRHADYQIDTKHRAIADVMRGLRRTKGTAQRQAAALTTPLIRRTSATCADRLIDLRDRALLLVGFAGALRRSELVGLDVADVVEVPEGLRITIRRSKSDQDGEGQVVQVGRTGRDTCPVTALAQWRDAAGIVEGRLLRSVDRYGRIGTSLSGRAVAQIVQRRARLAGLDGALYSGHSMRSGFASSAAEAGVEERVIAKQTRHKSMMMLRRYIREGELYRVNLAAEIGL